MLYWLSGGDGLLPATDAWEVESWVEWEERTLRRAIHGKDRAALVAALAKLSSAVTGRTHLVGDTLTLADIAVFGGLLPLMRQVRVVHVCTVSSIAAILLFLSRFNFWYFAG